MLKNFPSSLLFTPYKSAKNLNNYFPNKTSARSKKNYKFNDLNPVHSEKNFNAFNKTRNYKTPNRQPKSKITNSCLNLNSVNIPKKSENFFKNEKYISSPILNSQKNNKKILILDLDETLVHSAFYPFERKSDIILQINLEGKNHTIHVLKRPNLDYFLKKVSELFNIVIFTASIKEYAEPLINILDKEKKFGRMYRQNCLYNNGVYIKDLKKIGQNYQDMIIIDNNPISFSMNRDNGLPIETWYDNLDDNELIKLIPLLEFLSKVDDVRPIINQIINREKNEIDFNKVKKLLLNNGYINDNKNMINEASYNSYIKQSNKESIDYNKNDINNKNYLYNGKNIIFNFPYQNSNKFYSLSDMTYDEIQNEGYIEENENSNNMNIFNNYNKCIIKNKNRNNLFWKTKEIFNLSNSNEKKLIQYDNNNFSNYTQDNKDKKEQIIKKCDKYCNYNFNYGKENNLVYKDSITINYLEQNKITRENSFDKIGNNSYIKNKENNLNNTATYRNHSMINKKKSKNYDLFNNNSNNNNNSNDTFNKKQLYNKPINMKEKRNIGKDKFNNELMINDEIKEENNGFKTNIELRRERLEEMKKKIEEINKDIKNTEKLYHQNKNDINNNQDEYKLYDNNINYKSAKIISNKKSIYYNDENYNNMNLDNDIKSYRNQVIDTDINRNEINYDYNSQEKKNINLLFNSKINQPNNIFRNNNKNIFELKSDSSNLKNKYIQRIEKKYIHQTQNLNNKLKNRNIFKNFKNYFINKSNGKVDNIKDAYSSKYENNY